LALPDVLEKQMTLAEQDSQQKGRPGCCIWKFPFFACSSEKKKKKLKSPVAGNFPRWKILTYSLALNYAGL
jgi:hypothetical protein